MNKIIESSEYKICNLSEKTYDIFPFFNELDILELRLSTLSDVVDTFLIVESPWTFTGKEKPLYFLENKDRFSKWGSKIRHMVLKQMPNVGAWDREYYTRNMMHYGLYDAGDNDLIFFGDCDEIWDPKKKYLNLDSGKVTCYHMNLYYYNLNSQQLGMQWSIGTKRLRFKDWMGGQALRNYQPEVIIKDGGWHFSYAGDADHIANKLVSFSHTEYSGERYTNKESIKEKIAKGQDLFDRGIVYTTVPIDNSFPEPLVKENYKWQHLIKKADG